MDFGKNNYGQLGLGDQMNRSSPTQIGALRGWIYKTEFKFRNTSMFFQKNNFIDLRTVLKDSMYNMVMLLCKYIFKG